MKQRPKKLVSVLLALVMLLGMLPAFSVTALAAGVSYLDANGEEAQQADTTSVSSSTTAWSTGWYAADDNVTITGNVSLTGDVSLILCDGKTLTVTGSISGSGSLTVYGQSGGTGILTVNAPNGTDGDTPTNGADAIAVGKLTVYGGTINATGGNAGVADADKKFTVAGGHGGHGITATGDANGSTTFNIELYGGTVNAHGGTGGNIIIAGTRGNDFRLSTGQSGGTGVYGKMLIDGGNLNAYAGDAFSYYDYDNHPSPAVDEFKIYDLSRFFVGYGVDGVLKLEKGQLCAYGGRYNPYAKEDEGKNIRKVNGISKDLYEKSLLTSQVPDEFLYWYGHEDVFPAPEDWETKSSGYFVEHQSLVFMDLYNDFYTGYSGEKEDFYLEEDHIFATFGNYGFALVSVTTCKVTIKYNDGTTADRSVQYNIGDTIAKPADPAAREGYTFLGWFTNADCTDAFVEGTTASRNLTLYAGWERTKVHTPYKDASGETQTARAIPVTAAMKVWNAAEGDWYAVNSSVVIDGGVTILGDVNLILCEGAGLTVNGNVSAGDGGGTLKVYVQSSETVTLKVYFETIPVTYVGWDGPPKTKYLDEYGNPTEAAQGTLTLAADTQTWDDGKWYFAETTLTIPNRITVNGNVSLILGTGATLTAANGIQVEAGTLTIYAQNEVSGTLIATGGEGQTAIDGNVTVYGGSVEAAGGEGQAAIGGTLTVSDSMMVLSGSSPDPTTPLNSPYEGRGRYMNIGRPLYTIFLDNKDNWTAPTCYATDGGEKNNGTGGEAMTKDGSYWRLSVHFLPTQVTFYDGSTEKATANVTSFQTIGDEDFQFTALGGGCAGRFFVTQGGGIIVTLLYNGANHYPEVVTYRVESGRDLTQYTSLYDQYPTRGGDITDHWERIDQYGVGYNWGLPITESIVISCVYQEVYHTITLYKVLGWGETTVEDRTITVHAGDTIPIPEPANDSSNTHLKFQYWASKDTNYAARLRAGQKFDFSKPIYDDLVLEPVYSCPHPFSTYTDGKSFDLSGGLNFYYPHPSSKAECYELCVSRCDWCKQLFHFKHECEPVIYRGKFYESGYCTNPGCTYTDPNLNRTNYVKIVQKVIGDGMGDVFGGDVTLYEGNPKSYAVFTFNAPEYFGLVFDHYEITAQGSGKTVTQYDPNFSVSLTRNYNIKAYYRVGNFNPSVFHLFSSNSAVTITPYKYDTQYDGESEKEENAAYYANRVNLDVDWKLPEGAEIVAAGIYTTTNREMQKYNFGLNDSGKIEKIFDPSCLLKDSDADADFSPAKQEELKKRMIAGDGYCGDAAIHDFSAELLNDQGFYRVAHELPNTPEKIAYFGPWIYAMGCVTYMLNGEEVTEYTEPIALRLEDLAGLEADGALPVLMGQVADLLVYVDGEIDPSLSRTNMTAGNAVTLTAPAVAGKTFSHWAVGSADGPVASHQQVYMLGVKADTVLYAVYTTGTPADTGAAVAIVSMAKDNYMSNLAIKLNSVFSLPDGQSASSAGVIFTYNTLLGVADKGRDLLTNGIDGIDVAALLKSGEEDARLRVCSGERTGAFGGWSASLGLPGVNDHVYAVAFVETNGNRVYSDVLDVSWGDLSAVKTVTSAPVGFDLAVPAQPDP